MQCSEIHSVWPEMDWNFNFGSFQKENMSCYPSHPQIFDSKFPMISLDIICEWSVRSYKSRLSFRVLPETKGLFQKLKLCTVHGNAFWRVWQCTSYIILLRTLGIALQLKPQGGYIQNPGSRQLINLYHCHSCVAWFNPSNGHWFRGCQSPKEATDSNLGFHHGNNNNNNKQQTTNNKQQMTNDKRQTTNDKRQTTNDKRQTTNNKQQTTTNKQQPTTNNQQTTTNNQQPTTNNNNNNNNRRQRKRHLCQTHHHQQKDSWHKVSSWTFAIPKGWSSKHQLFQSATALRFIINGDIIDKVPSMTHSTIVGAAVPFTAPEYQRKIQATKAAMTFGRNRRLRWNRNLFEYRIHIWYIYLYPHENHKNQHGFLIKRKHLSQIFRYISYV